MKKDVNRIKQLKKQISRQQFQNLFSKISKKNMPMPIVIDVIAERFNITPADVKDLIQTYCKTRITKQEIIIEKYGREGILKLYAEKNITELSEELDISMKTCRDIFKKLNIKTKKPTLKKPVIDKILSEYTKNELQEMYNNMFLLDMAKKLNVGGETLRKIFKKLDISAPKDRFTPAQKEIYSKYSIKDMEKLFKDKTIIDLAKYLNVSVLTCYKVLKHYKISTERKTFDIIEKSILNIYSINEIKKMQNEMTNIEIAKKLNCSIQMLTKLYKKHNIEKQKLTPVKDFVNDMKKMYTRQDILKMRDEMSVNEFCTKFKIQPYVYAKLLNEYDIQGNKKLKVKELIKTYTKEDILEMRRTMTHIQIRNKLGFPCKTYFELLKQLGVPRERTVSMKLEDAIKKYSKSEILEMLKTYNHKEISEKYNISLFILKGLIKYYDITLPKKLSLEELSKKYTRNHILDLQKTMSNKKIEEYLNIPHTTFYRLLKKLELA